MSKKKHPEHVNHERWLVSYADFITLLFAFFVVLFASGQADKKKQSRLAVVMQSAFTPLGTFDAHSKTPALESGGGTSSNTTPAPIQPPIPTVEDISTQAAAESAFDTQLQAAIQTESRTSAQINSMLSATLAAKSPGAGLKPGSITVHSTPQGLVLSLHEAGFFSSASADVDPASIPILRKLVATLPPGPFRVEGHTDNVPIHTAQFASNWELSTARAATIARLLLQSSNVPPADLSAAGYAEFHPIAPNTTEADRAQNRRVDIILLRPVAPLRAAAASSSSPSTPTPPAPSQ